MSLSMQATPAPKRNIELKVRCHDLSAALVKLRTLSPLVDTGIQHQVDTYFHATTGRLKLREITGMKSELIWYDRSNSAVSRKSDYRLTPVTHPLELKASLIAAMGLRVAVVKHRHVFLWHNVRIHLDRVDGLGSFIEFEAVISGGDDEQTGHQRLKYLCGILELPSADFLEQSYVDLLIEGGQKTGEPAL